MIEESSDEDERGFVIVSRQRIYRPRQEYLNAGDFRERFRLMPWQAEILSDIVGPQISTQEWNLTAMSPRHKLMAALRFYALNNSYDFGGDAQGKKFTS